MTKYITKPDKWFDAGTEAELVTDLRPIMPCGIFRGIRNGQVDEELCPFSEFEIVSTSDAGTTPTPESGT